MPRLRCHLADVHLPPKDPLRCPGHVEQVVIIGVTDCEDVTTLSVRARTKRRFPCRRSPTSPAATKWFASRMAVERETPNRSASSVSENSYSGCRNSQARKLPWNGDRKSGSNGGGACCITCNVAHGLYTIKQ